ncbi:DNA-directed RNA polymerase I subunit RPA1 [Lepeophtheirus salmonis]|uniref:DNA-directed RNA polymerase I subunit RPA1 n=1 Tax=Lepeophtheirus salmonis TaxID=72036 RepID=UPI001AE158D6|nr:DNA-directed RNA polymerase I subunit RPA1-like [Lepeophtheirus salmonis]
MYPMLKDCSDMEHPTDIFFLNVVAVPPPKSRPCQYTGRIMTIHPQGASLQILVETVTIMKQIVQNINEESSEDLSSEAQEMLRTIRGDTMPMKLNYVWKVLQNCVDHLLDREMNASQKNSSGWGFKQLIERKTGLFRMHMMGKRVNFAARTVITPDPYINIDEIGLPEVFAKKLSYCVPVTPWNVEELRELVINGPNVHPGALFIETESGQRKMIDGNDPIQREALAKTLLTPSSDPGEDKMKFVYRHLINGDRMLLNRQPTLHKPSIMSHRARVLKGEKVMRLHYAVCKSYNADFDGDEMNAHFPQNEVARSEAQNLVGVSEQYLVPKDGTPLQGLIQDHVIAGVKMSIRGRFFDQAEYQQLVYSALINVKGKIKCLPPAIFKPKKLWSGKQIISTIILNSIPPGRESVTLFSKTKIKSSDWLNQNPRPWKTSRLGSHSVKKGCSMCESEVIFSNGELVCGVIDKNQYGATMYSLVHTFYELYGGTSSSELLSAFSRIFTNFLHTEGFTLGVSDILVQSDANENREEIMKQLKNIGDECATSGVSLNANLGSLNSELRRFHRESYKAPQKRMKVDKGYKERLGPMTNRINSACLPRGLIKKFPENNLQLMVQAGAKGSTVNTMQISCLLGQIELEGKRPPIMISGRSLPSFLPYDTQPRAGGFIDGRFMTGIKPQEFFFHCMAGREGLIDTAVKTSRSGYLQRCLIKLLEGLVVNYDLTVRDSDGSVVQFQYGEDSLDVCKSQYIVPNQMAFLYDNMKSVINPSTLKLISEHCMNNSDELNELKSKIRKKRKKVRGMKCRDGAFLRFSRDNSESSMHDINKIDPKTGRSFRTNFLIKKWSEDDDSQNHFKKKYVQVPDPCTSVFRPDSNFGSVAEKVEDLIQSYLKNNKSDKGEQFRDIMYAKYMKSMVDPGEPVGVLAGQSVGEPSTQMTLNTFHFAGCGEMNVTLGIPRLREILMVASSNIKTPSSVIHFLPHVLESEKDKLRIKLNRCALSDVLESVHVTEKISLFGSSRCRIIKIRLQFLPRKAYKNDFSVTPSSILSYVERYFFSKVLIPLIDATLLDKKLVVETGTSKSKSNNNIDDEDPDSSDKQQKQKGFDAEEHASSDEEEQPDDADATEVKKMNRQMDDDYDEGLSDEETQMLNDFEKDENKSDEDDESSQKYNEDELLGQKDDIPIISRSISASEVQKRRTHVKNLTMSKKTSFHILEYALDEKKELWSEITLGFPVDQKKLDFSNLIKTAAVKGVIYEIKNINKAYLTKDENEETTITTDGINIEAMFQFDDLLDINRLRCNSIHDMARYYGIEAANRTITSEIVNVFKAYGITINHRHLTLIADYMTFDGSYKPFNRVGIENNPSPLQQMTFETAIGFLRSATIQGKKDNLQSPSSCIILGKPWFGGTSSFKIMQKLSIKT